MDVKSNKNTKQQYFFAKCAYKKLNYGEGDNLKKTAEVRAKCKRT
jgi:hypothetical protein